MSADAGLASDAAVVIDGVPHEVLQGLMRTGQADVVVMGAVARGRLAELVMGYTAERVLHGSSRDVLIVKARVNAHA